MGDKIRSFTDLKVWQKGHVLVVFIYRITKNFSKEETFGLTSQIRRCSVSVTSNIAEGFSRASYKEKVKFYYISYGSICELQNQLLIARDVGYLHNNLFNDIANKTVELQKMLNTLIKTSKLNYSKF